MAAGSEGTLLGWYRTEELEALVRFGAGDPVRVPADALEKVERE